MKNTGIKNRENHGATRQVLLLCRKIRSVLPVCLFIAF